jgi:hypothetical protein
LALSIVVGLARGARSRVWVDLDRLTIALFIALVASLFAIGTACYLWGISNAGGFGEVMLMIAFMVAFQAQITWRRARPLGRASCARRHRRRSSRRRSRPPVSRTPVGYPER